MASDKDQQGDGDVKSIVAKRSVVIAGHKTSVSLEDAFWESLKDIATTKRTSLNELVGRIDNDRWCCPRLTGHPATWPEHE
jgi:predicted DNA-binding ribbon-helix-helix protein